MKIDFRDNSFIVFLNKKYINQIDFFDKRNLEDYFRNLFIKFKNVYDIEVSGSYNIEIFKDVNCGMILSIEEDDNSYFDYYDDQIDMNIIISKYDKFVYKLNGNLDDKFINKCEIYLYNNDIYVVPKRVSFIDGGYLMENSEVIYGKKAMDVIKSGFMIPNKIYVG